MKFRTVKCNICNLDRTVTLGKRLGPGWDNSQETNIVKCRLCGLIYPNPMPCPEDEEIQDNFKDPQTYFSGEITDERIRKYEKALRLIEDAKPEKGYLLDVGCGRGELVYAARKLGWRSLGTEVSKDFAQYARDRFNLDVLEGDINDLALPKGSYDSVSLSSVIQYVQDPLRTLRTINSLLKTDGILYIEVTNEDALVFRVGDLFESLKALRTITTHLSPLFPTYQIYGFNKRSLETALGLAGFDIVYFRVKGAFGGGEVKGTGLTNKVINLIRKVIILIGGLTGNGHLIYCLAKKSKEI